MEIVLQRSSLNVKNRFIVLKDLITVEEKHGALLSFSDFNITVTI